MVECKICGSHFKMFAGLSRHLKFTHKVDQEDYYLKYVSNIKPKCFNCGKTSKFHSIKKGYRNLCSVKCTQENATNNIRLSTRKRSQAYLDMYSLIYNDYVSGISLRSLGKIYGLSHKTIKANFDSLGYRIKSTSNTAKDRCAKQKETVIAKYKNDDAFNKAYDMYMSSYNYDDIMKLFDCDMSPNKFLRIIGWLGFDFRCEEASNKAKSIPRDDFIDAHEVTKMFNEHINNKVPISYLSGKYGYSESSIGRYFKKNGFSPIMFGSSKFESELYDIIKSQGFNVVRNDRSVIWKQSTKRFLELDLFIQEENIAIEVNNYYTHSGKDRDYHTFKTEKCLDAGISLIHVWDNYKHSNIKARILGVLGVYENKYHARKCDIVVNHENARLFIDENHLDGYVGSLFSVSLIYDGEIVSSISFRRNEEYMEIARFCSKAGCVVNGGFSKLMKFCIKYIKINHTMYSTILTYADIDWTPDYKNCVYFKYGMEYCGKTRNKLIYSSKSRTYSRQGLQKHKLKEKYPNAYSDELTANEILAKVGIRPIYKTGNHKFILRI